MLHFSIIMPMRNAEPFVQEAIQSILDQAGVELEIIVVDDGSSDRSAEMVRGMGEARIRLVPGPCQGISRAFNEGLRHARGEWICRCDADDRYAPGRLAWQEAALGERPEFGAVCGAFSSMTEQGRAVADLTADLPAGEITEELRQGHHADLPLHLRDSGGASARAGRVPAVLRHGGGY